MRRVYNSIIDYNAHKNPFLNELRKSQQTTHHSNKIIGKKFLLPKNRHHVKDEIHNFIPYPFKSVNGIADIHIETHSSTEEILQEFSLNNVKEIEIEK